MGEAYFWLERGRAQPSPYMILTLKHLILKDFKDFDFKRF
jgi:hypothetical protein